MRDVDAADLAGGSVDVVCVAGHGTLALSAKVLSPEARAKVQITAGAEGARPLGFGRALLRSGARRPRDTPSTLLPTLDELLTMSWVRCRCLYFPLGGEGDPGGAVPPADLRDFTDLHEPRVPPGIQRLMDPRGSGEPADKRGAQTTVKYLF